MESKRKLMDELLTLKQEVTQLRRAAELNEEEDGAVNKSQQSKDMVFKRLKE